MQTHTDTHRNIHTASTEAELCYSSTTISVALTLAVTAGAATVVVAVAAISRVAKRQRRRMGAVLIFNCVDAAVACVVAVAVTVRVRVRVTENACTERQSVGWFGAVWSRSRLCAARVAFALFLSLLFSSASAYTSVLSLLVLL